MEVTHIDHMRRAASPLADLIKPGVGFRLGSESTAFSPVAAGEDQWTYQDADKALQVDVHLHRTGDGFVIRSRLKSIGSEAISGVRILEPLHVLFAQPGERWRHIFANGGTTEGFYPPTAYRTQEWTQANQTLKIESHPLGRSSNQHLPLLISLVSVEEVSPGLYAGMAWSGAWYMHFGKRDENTSFLSVGVQVNDMELTPGESLDLPDVHIGFFRGGVQAGTNALRRHLYEHVCPRYRGQPTLPRVSYDHWFGIGNGMDMNVLSRQARRAAELGIEVFVVDAGWFPGGFPDGVGNWRVDTGKFPQGLQGIAECVRSLGMDFGLWFEIERAAPETEAVLKHSDLFFPVPGFPAAGGMPGRQYHLNLARKDAQDWAIETVSSMIRDLDLRWSRWDYNIEPMPYWKAIDPTLKIQFDYFKGLYRVLDTLMAEHPNWMVEGCASGGRRIDIGTMRRAHTYWFSDQTSKPALCRYMQARANRFLPGHLLNSSVAVGCGGKHGDQGFTDNAVLSRMLGKLSFDGDIASWSPELTRRMGAWVREFKNIRHLLVQDFYQLLPQPSTADAWDAVQFTSYSGDESALFVFSGCQAGAVTVKPLGLHAERNYRVSRLPEGLVTTHTGRDLICDGLTVAMGGQDGGIWKIVESKTAGSDA